MQIYQLVVPTISLDHCRKHFKLRRTSFHVTAQTWKKCSALCRDRQRQIEVLYYRADVDAMALLRVNLYLKQTILITAAIFMHYL